MWSKGRDAKAEAVCCWRAQDYLGRLLRMSLRNISIYDLEVRQNGSCYELYINDAPIETPIGSRFSDTDRSVAQMILDDLRDVDTLAIDGMQLQFTGDVSCYELHCVSAAWSSDQDVEIASAAHREFYGDGAGAGPLATVGHDSLLDRLWTVVHGSASTTHQTFQNLLKILEGLSAPQRACVRCMAARHGTPVWMAAVFVAKGFSSSEYARAMTEFDKGRNELIKNESISVQMGRFDRFRRGAWRVERFLAALKESVRFVIETGESETVEYKSTWRYNLATKQFDGRLTIAALKTVAAFLNSGGGTLVIGLNDSGDAIPNLVRADGFDNEDKYLLHIIAKMRTTLGDAAAARARARFGTYGGNRVCVIHCARSEQPVFLRASKNEQHYFVRIGPSSVSLSISEAVGHIRLSFPSYGAIDEL